MTSTTFDRAIANVQAAASRADELGTRALDEAVASLMQLNDPRCIQPLLLALADDAQYDEAMFSLIHAAEAFDHDIYVREMCAALPALCARAPEWASAVFMRVLNNRDTLALMVRQVRAADDGVRTAVLTLCEKINTLRPSFSEKTLPLFLAAEQRR